MTAFRCVTISVKATAFDGHIMQRKEGLTMAKEYKMYINGEWIGAENRETFEVIDPSNGEVIGIVPVATQDDVNKACFSG